MAIYIGNTLIVGGCGGGGGGGGGEVDPGFPTDNLVALWEATDLDLADGAVMDEWPPSFGGGTAVSVSSTKPVFRAHGSRAYPNGGPMVAFNNSPLVWSDLGGMPAGDEPATFMAIVNLAIQTGFAYAHVAQFGAPNAAQARGLAYGAGNIWRTHEWGAGVTSSPFIYDPRPHVVWQTYDGSVVRLYVDGAYVGQYTRALNTASGPGSSFVFGARLGADAEYGIVLVGAAAVWDGVLDDAGTAQAMNHARIAYGVYS